MKGVTCWHSRPFFPLDRRAEEQLPYIARVAPLREGVEIEWFDRGSDRPHILCFRRYKSDTPMTEIPLRGPCAEIVGLCEEQDYEMYIRREDGTGRSRVRLFRTGCVPGRVINYLHPEDTAYAFSGRALCSPSLARLPSGRLVASMDLFAPRAAQNLTLLFYSEDRGSSWRYLCDLFPCYWGKLFVHRGRLFMLSQTAEYGDIQIGSSDDDGRTWTLPTALFRGSGIHCASGPLHAPMPVLQHRGRLYTGVEFGSFEVDRGHASGMLSADANADLLRPESWTISDFFLRYDPRWPGAAAGFAQGALEGNFVVTPEGELACFSRYQMETASPSHGMAVRLSANADRPEEPLAFHSFVRMNGGSNSKFHLMRDGCTGWYIALCNETVDGGSPTMRSVLSLAVSADLEHFTIAERLIDCSHLPPGDVGFQYCDFVIDGEDLLVVCRTAFNRARNFHDANYSTFHVVPRFRDLCSRALSLPLPADGMQSRTDL